MLWLTVTTALASPWISEQPGPGGVPLVSDGYAATIVFSPGDFKVVDLAAHDLAGDIQRVTGVKPSVGSLPPGSGPAVLVGTLGHSPLIDDLVAAGKLDVRDLRGAWESFVIATVANPSPGASGALVIVGSDRRGTAFGIFELSQAIGVSPWYWWADVPPAKKSALYVAAGTRRFGPPSVQYRGIFINDEDWGLQPWAAKTFEPESGDIGPKTYAKVCELLLRLKANTLWPAMHPSTKAFNSFPQNKQVADDYAIVMGSSHAEPMLRNNVGEWTARKEDYDYVHNRDGVLAYWEQRIKDNGQFENIYTLGMRGIHDSNMIGPKTDAERIATLEKIFADQRELIAQYARPVGASLDDARGRRQATPLQIEQIPQMFCAYKEVLALYRQGLKVPDDVTIVWPDDNFGYVRNFASPEELKRSGGFGIYYHLSYLGAPLSYLWLATTPPALIWEEMSKAYDRGARKIWIANVGDIKPGEIAMEFFLQMAWDIGRWNAANQHQFIAEWAAREFPGAHAGDIANVMTDYYRLNFERRPEHLQWWLRNEAPRPSPLSAKEIDARLGDFAALRHQVDELATDLPAEQRDAFTELVGYPVRGSALANARYFHGERGQTDQALAADTELREITRRLNQETAGGKWRGMTSLEPADQQFQSMRILPWTPRAFTPKPIPGGPEAIVIPLDHNKQVIDRSGASWRDLRGLGVAVLPGNFKGSSETKISTEAPELAFAVELPTAGANTLTVRLLPTHAIVAGRGLRFAIALDNEPPQILVYPDNEGSPEWTQGVLNNYVTVSATFAIPSAGKHILHLYGIDPGVVVQRIEIRPPG